MGSELGVLGLCVGVGLGGGLPWRGWKPQGCLAVEAAQRQLFLGVSVRVAPLRAGGRLAEGQGQDLGLLLVEAELDATATGQSQLPLGHAELLAQSPWAALLAAQPIQSHAAAQAGVQPTLRVIANHTLEQAGGERLIYVTVDYLQVQVIF